MSNDAPTRPFGAAQALRRNSERIAFCALVTWCLLPAAMVLVDFYYGASSGLSFVDEYVIFGPVCIQALALYRRLFLVLGALTIIVALMLVAVCGKRLFSRETVRQQPWIYLLLALLLWAMVSTALSDRPALQFAGGSVRCDGLFSYFVYAAVFCCALRLRDERLRRIVLNLFVGVVDAMCVVMLCQAFQVPVIYQTFESPFAAVFNQFNHLGYMLCMGGLCAAGLFLHDDTSKGRVAHMASFALIVFALLANDTFGCYLATVVGLCAIAVFGARKQGKVKRVILVPIAIFAVLSIASASGLMAPITNGGGGLGRNLFQISSDLVAIGDGSPEAMRAGTGRMQLWVSALQMIPDRPLFGYGPEGLLGAYTQANGVDRPHNEVIQYAVFLGIPALLLYLAALLSLAIRQWKALKELPVSVVVAMGVVVGYFASSLFGNTMFNTAPYFWMMLGFAAWLSAADRPLLDDAAPQRASLLAASSIARISFAVLSIVLVVSLLIMGFTL